MPEIAASRVALVTGGGRGIGAALATGLAAEGLAVGLLGRTEATLEATAARCAGHGVSVATAVADVTDPIAVEAAVGRLGAALGPADLLVSNAGIVDDGEMPFADADLANLWRVVEVNLRGPMVVAHAVLPGMLARGGGRIVHLGSGFASRLGPGYTGYAVAKGALARLTSMLAFQYADRGIVVLDLSPGLVRTDLTEAMPLWTGRADAPWGTVAPMVNAVRRAARGDLDGLSGRLVHAQADDLDDLLAHRDQIVATDARRLRYPPYGPEDSTV